MIRPRTTSLWPCLALPCLCVENAMWAALSREPWFDSAISTSDCQLCRFRAILAASTWVRVPTMA